MVSRGNAQLGKCLIGKLSGRGISQLGNCISGLSVGERSCRQTVWISYKKCNLQRIMKIVVETSLVQAYESMKI